MDDTAPSSSACPDCTEPYDAADNYCRSCGMFLADHRMIIARQQSGALELRRPGLPVPLKRAATAVAVGTALQIGAALAGKYLAHRAASTAAGRTSKRALSRRNEERSPATVVSEALFVRRTWIHRD